MFWQKTCKSCAADLPHTDFVPTDKSPDGRYPYCNACRLAHPVLDYRRCNTCGKTRRLTQFPGLAAEGPCSYCAASYNGAAAGMLAAAKLRPDGFTTVGDLLRRLGHPAPSKSDLNQGAKWLHAHGYRRAKIRGTLGFRVSPLIDNGRVTAFRQWAEQHGRVADLGLPDDYVAGLMAGDPIPPFVGYAMAAISAGLALPETVGYSSPTPNDNGQTP